GRPDGKRVPEMSLRPVAEALAALLDGPVAFAEDCVGLAAETAGAVMGGGDVLLLENLRFHAEEEKNDPAFARQLAALADVYVNDAFGAAHRAHASVDAIGKYVSSAAAGLLMEKELEYLGRVLQSPERPLVAILGGAELSDKLERIQNFRSKVDRLIIGGAMAYTFFKANGVPVGRSLVEGDLLDAARNIEARAKQLGLQLGLPSDHVVTEKIEAGAARETLKVGDPAIGNRMRGDICAETIRAYTSMLADAKTVVWNGPMGVFEIPEFAEGTNAVARAV